LRKYPYVKKAPEHLLTPSSRKENEEESLGGEEGKREIRTMFNLLPPEKRRVPLSEAIPSEEEAGLEAHLFRERACAPRRRFCGER